LFGDKSFRLVRVHGLCSCGSYYQASIRLAPLEFELPVEAREMPHVHFTVRCWSCGRLVNLVSIEKEPLKRGAEDSKHGFEGCR
jgi:hypothetical protein